MPRPPANADEIDVMFKNDRLRGEFSRTKHEKDEFYLFKGVGSLDGMSYALLGSDHVMRNIKADIPEADRQYVMDATLKVCPMGNHYQLLNVYIGFCGHATQFFYALMSHKSLVCYLQVLEKFMKYYTNSLDTVYSCWSKNLTNFKKLPRFISLLPRMSFWASNEPVARVLKPNTDILCAPYLYIAP